jgi:hypothetical protein
MSKKLRKKDFIASSQRVSVKAYTRPVPHHYKKTLAKDDKPEKKRKHRKHKSKKHKRA